MGFGQDAHVYVEKMRAELHELELQGVILAGNAFSPVLVVKGEQGPAETSGGALLSGADGKALRAALTKLGYAPEEWCALACWRQDGGFLTPALARLAIATLSPSTLIAADEVAAALISDAYVGEQPRLDLGRVSMVAGMRVLRLGGFEAALGDMRSKQRMWARLKLIPPLVEPY